MAIAPITVSTIWASVARPSRTSGSACSRASSDFGSSWVMILSALRQETTGEEIHRFRAGRFSVRRSCTAAQSKKQQVSSSGVGDDGDDPPRLRIHDDQLI